MPAGERLGYAASGCTLGDGDTCICYASLLFELFLSMDDIHSTTDINRRSPLPIYLTIILDHYYLVTLGFKTFLMPFQFVVWCGWDWLELLHWDRDMHTTL